MSDPDYSDTRTATAATPRQWKYWFLLSTAALVPLYVVVLSLLVV